MKSYENDAKQPTGATLFGGFEGVGVGMKAAGIEHAWSIEYNAQIAAVAQLNGFNTIVADIMDCDPADFEPVQFLHTSPPCLNFSPAKTNGEETELDIALAEKVAEFITVLLPDYFTLENVFAYRNSKSWETIARALLFHGYQFNYWHCNMADYGVPQTRKRMIVIARRDGRRPQLPPATHAENPQVGLFGVLRPWVGWHETIEDLIPSMRKGHLTERHKRLDLLSIKEPSLITNQNGRDDDTPQLIGLNGKFSLTAQSLLGWRYVNLPVGDIRLVSRKAFGRLASFPDCYEYPTSKSLSCKGVGNAVPPLFAQRLFESLL